MSGSMLMQASHQWSSRPADERFSSLASLDAAVQHHRAVAVEAPEVPLRSLSVVGTADGDVALQGGRGAQATFTHYSFGQLARRVGAPADYLRTLPSSLVIDNLNHGITKLDEARDGDGTAKLLFAQNGDLKLRAITSDKYTRIWNADITTRLIRLTEQNPEWQPAPAAFDGSRGLYASDRDMFAFLVDNDRRIFEQDKHGGLGRGFFAWNSEVGDGSFGVTTFFYEYVCGNHRVWGASGVQELRIRHVGNADDRAFSSLRMELRKYADSSAAADEAKITRAMHYELGESKDAVLDRVFGLRINGLSQKRIEAAYDLAEQREDWYGSPRSVWGLTGGMTEIARDLPNANDRVALDRAAGKVMQIAF